MGTAVVQHPHHSHKQPWVGGGVKSLSLLWAFQFLLPESPHSSSFIAEIYPGSRNAKGDFILKSRILIFDTEYSIK